MSTTSRITKEHLEMMEKRVNEHLKRYNIQVAYRYGYTALDLRTKNGILYDTLATGLTKREAYTILYAIFTILKLESTN